MLKLTGAVILSIMAAGQSHAEERGLGVEKCWMVPPHPDMAKMKASIEAKLSSTGQVEDIKIISAPSGKVGESFLASARRAVLRCAPYPDLKGETVIFNFDGKPIYPN